MHNHNGNLPSTDHLRYELGKNVAIKGSKLINGPTWSRVAHEDKSLTTSCVHFVIHDPNCQKTTQITQACNCIYGKPVAIKIATLSWAYTQCSRCHALTHNIDHCTHPPTFVRYGFCRKRDDPSSSHCAVICSGTHNTIDCQCLPFCFNCRVANKPAAGHWAITDNCPLKKNMRTPSPPANLAQTNMPAPEAAASQPIVQI